MSLRDRGRKLSDEQIAFCLNMFLIGLAWIVLFLLLLAIFSVPN